MFADSKSAVSNPAAEHSVPLHARAFRLVAKSLGKLLWC
jgi:hypothetical protein